jgi:hypothetical protein
MGDPPSNSAASHGHPPDKASWQRIRAMVSVIGAGASMAGAVVARMGCCS